MSNEFSPEFATHRMLQHALDARILLSPDMGDPIAFRKAIDGVLANADRLRRWHERRVVIGLTHDPDCLSAVMREARPSKENVA